MTNGLLTDRGAKAFDCLKPKVRTLLVTFNDQRFAQTPSAITEFRDALTVARAREDSTDESYLTDMYVLDRYVDFLAAYGGLWEKMIQQQFSASWNDLQDALDLLRLVKRFSALDVVFFEKQLLEVERMYPYNVFFSIGATVERFECSLCGADIDSIECPHMRGHLYGGVMATAIARNITTLDHVSMVPNPENKRCVVTYEDSSEQFKLIRYLSTLLASRRCRLLDFSHLRFSKRRVVNPNNRKEGRNDPCYCGSGKKFKRCCESKEYIETDHVDVVAEPKRIEDAVP